MIKEIRGIPGRDQAGHSDYTSNGFTYRLFPVSAKGCSGKPIPFASLPKTPFCVWMWPSMFCGS